MTFHQLEIFDAVAERLSITEAARKIKISQPSVSKQLRFLKRECGLKLYVETVEKMVLDGDVEIAVTTILPDHSQIVAEPINSEGIVAVVSVNHELASKRRLSKAEAMKVPFVMTTGGRIVEELKKIGLRLNVVMWCESIDLKTAAVQAGLGVGLFYRGSAETGLRQGYFKAIEMPWLKDINIASFVIYRKGTQLSPNLLSFLSLLRRSSKA